MHYIVYLDEFGHVGPFLSREDPQHNTNPVFGLGGMILPSDKVRAFSTLFYQIKERLLSFEIERAGKPAYEWEKKGSSLLTTQNVEKYPELRRAIFRILNRIATDGGRVIYVGMKKTQSPEEADSKSLYRAVLREMIKRCDQFCSERSSEFLIVLDKQEGEDFRRKIVAEATIQMYGEAGRKTLIEPPIETESHLFQTLQCADWICGLVGRIGAYRACPDQYPDLEWSVKYFGERLARIAPNSGIRLEKRSIITKI